MGDIHFLIFPALKLREWLKMSSVRVMMTMIENNVDDGDDGDCLDYLDDGNNLDDGDYLDDGDDLDDGGDCDHHNDGPHDARNEGN